MYDIVRKFDKLSTQEKQKISKEVSDLHMLIEDLSERIDRLEKECPADRTSFRGEIEDTVKHLQPHILTFCEKTHWG